MELNELIQLRRSVRAYAAEDKIPVEDVKQIIAAAQLAPSWKNSQTARIYAAVSPEKVAAVRAALPGFNQKSTANAAAYLVTTFVRGVAGHTAGQPDNELGDQWGAYDLGLNNAYVILKARDLGYDTLIMGLRDADALRAALEIPAEEQVCAVLALGHREGEPVFRPRREMNEVSRIL